MRINKRVWAHVSKFFFSLVYISDTMDIAQSPPPYNTLVSANIGPLTGSDLRQYVDTIVKNSIDPIAMTDYLQHRLSPENMRLFTDLLKLRIETDDPYPVVFDDLWPKIGYTFKKHAVTALKKNYRENLDFILLPVIRQQDERPHGGSNRDDYMLSLECAKLFSASASTEQGRSIAVFFVKFHAVMEEYALIQNGIERKLVAMQTRHQTLLRAFGGRDLMYKALINLTIRPIFTRWAKPVISSHDRKNRRGNTDHFIWIWSSRPHTSTESSKWSLSTQT
jgi:phage anti-repressor protein